MAKIIIDEKEYETENLPKEVLELINSINFVDIEIQKLQNQIKVYQTARALYSQQLKQKLENLNDINFSIDKIKFS